MDDVLFKIGIIATKIGMVVYCVAMPLIVFLLLAQIRFILSDGRIENLESQVEFLNAELYSGREAMEKLDETIVQTRTMQRSKFLREENNE